MAVRLRALWYRYGIGRFAVHLRTCGAAFFLRLPRGGGPLVARRNGTVMRIYLMLLLSLTCQAATHYVRASATGSNDGSSWASAFTSIPTSLVRGDTYYIAGGTFPGNATLVDRKSVV